MAAVAAAAVPAAAGAPRLELAAELAVAGAGDGTARAEGGAGVGTTRAGGGAGAGATGGSGLRGAWWHPASSTSAASAALVARVTPPRTAARLLELGDHILGQLRL